MNQEEPATPEKRPPSKRLHWPTPPPGMSAVGFAQVGLFVIALCYALHEMKAVLLPMVLAGMVSLILHPVNLLLQRSRLPRLICSAMTVVGLMTILCFGAYKAILPGAEWARDMDEEEVLGRVQAVFRPMKQAQAGIKKMADRVEEATQEGAAPMETETDLSPEGQAPESKKGANKPKEAHSTVPPPSPDTPKDKSGLASELKGGDPNADDGESPPKEKPMRVEIHEDPVGLLYQQSRDFGLGFVAFLLMVFFILTYGHRILSHLYRDHRLQTILNRMGKEVSWYLLTITIINACLGACVAAAMWGLGMPRPILWGLMAMILNYVPYVGALTGMLVVFIAASVSFERPAEVIVVPITYFVLTAAEGNLVTPAVLGGRFKINPLLVFVWIFAWAGFWGIAGMLIAMPALVIFKIVCENSEKLTKFRRLLAA